MTDFDDSFDTALASLDLPPPAKLSAVVETPSEDVSLSQTATKKVLKQNCVLVNPKQRGNPILKSITNVAWEWDDIVPDYIVGSTTCILYLSLKYHNLNPDYIHQRLKSLGKMFELRILLVQVDVKEPHNALKTLTRICLLANLTLILAWSFEEAGNIVETYKMYENKPPDMIMEKSEDDPHTRLCVALTNIKPVNKTDAMTLLANFGTLENLINSSEEKLGSVSGLGPRKVSKLFKTLNEPFLK
ncbi:DNA excision repair protein ERCC-1 [Culicoides brevitarsis]|uniref:DNA excision repair protein ERCC-1 n=1 Tax=Culicoides brevitarsis TaxID=469753 RepID=UPI00307B1DB6